MFETFLPGALIFVVAVILRTIFGLFFLAGKNRAAFAEGQPGVTEAAKAFRRKDWKAVEALYADRSPSDRYHFLQGLALATKLDGLLPAKPQGALAVITAGICVGWAWRHRGGGLGASVSDKAALKMSTLLSRALALVEDLGSEADSVSVAIAIRAEMGLEGNFAALQRQLSIAEHASEQNVFVPRNHIMFVAPKWRGSIDEMFDVARDYASRSSNPAWMVLPAMAHAEAILFRLSMNDDAADRRVAHEFYVESDAYKLELETIDDAFWKARNKGDVRMAIAEQLFAHNMLGYVLYRRRMYGRLARHLDAIGPDLMEIPWAYSGYGRGSIAALRREVGLS